MKNYFTYQKKIRDALIVFALSIFLMFGGCYTIAYIIQPDVVSPNSAFDVKICVRLSGDYEDSDYFPAYGFLGILLPEGWTVKDSVKYTEKMYQSTNKDGYFRYNDDAVYFLKNYVSSPPEGYYWWGAKTIEKLDIASLDSGFIHLTIFTDDKAGQFNTKYILGDDTDWNKMIIGDLFGKVTESDLIPVKSGTVTHATTSWKNEEWKLYPNPSNGQIFIKQPNFSDEVIMKIYDLYGRLQKSEILHESLTRIDLSTFSKGTYIVSIEKQGETKTQKITIH
jgi:hypothetical protein